jgi:FixJ family two-component response regulator
MEVQFLNSHLTTIPRKIGSTCPVSPQGIAQRPRQKSALSRFSGDFNPGPFETDEAAEAERPLIYLLDGDPRERGMLSGLFRSSGWDVISFGTAQEYLECERTGSCACLVVNPMLPDMNGLDIQQQLSDRDPPVIFVAASADIPSIVRAMKAGAVEFLTRPVSESGLIAAVEIGLAQDRDRRQRSLELQKIEKRLSLLTPREREVLPLVAEGLPNKQAAAILGISGVTLQVHRGQIMRKMAARSFADLVRMADKLGIRAATGNPERSPAQMLKSAACGYSGSCRTERSGAVRAFGRQSSTVAPGLRTPGPRAIGAV